MTDAVPAPAITKTTVAIEATLLGSAVRLAASASLASQLRAQLAELLAEPAAEGHEPAEIDLGDEDVQAALAEITAWAVSHSKLLCVHAGVVAGSAGTVVLPAPSGHGKTTLVAALVQRGFGYVSDEVFAVDRGHHGTVTPFPRPLALSPRSWECLGLPADQAPEAGFEALVRPAELGMIGPVATVSDVVLFTRDEGPPALAVGERGDAVRALLEHSFNHWRDPGGSFRAAVAVARHARVWRLSYAEAPDAARALADRLLGESGSQPGRLRHAGST